MKGEIYQACCIVASAKNALKSGCTYQPVMQKYVDSTTFTFINRDISFKKNNSDDASGILVEGLLESMAEYYSAELSQNIKRGMNLNAQKCLCTGGNIALGFMVDDTKHFIIDEDTAPIVHKVFELYADGNSAIEICNYLNIKGFKTSRGAEFNKNSLRTMLKNKRYIGIYTYNGTEIKDGLPRIIGDDLFYKVQDVLAKNKKAPARSRAKVEYLLTTKLFYGKCRTRNCLKSSS